MEITTICPKCEKTYSTDITFCNECGTKTVSPEQMIPKCVKCETVYTDGTKFCSLDGGKVVPEALRNMFSSVSDLQSAKNVASNVIGDLSSGISVPIGVLVGTIGVILFSLFDWVRISALGFGTGANLFGIAGKINNLARTLRLDSEIVTTIRVFAVILVIALIASFVMLIASLLMKPHQSGSKSRLAFDGFAVCAAVTAIFIVTMGIATMEVPLSGLTVFPFLTLAIAILAMIFIYPNIKCSLNSNAVLMLGVASILTSLIPIVGLVVGCICVILWRSAMKRYEKTPDLYFKSSYQRLTIGKICSIIGLCISIMVTVFIVIILVTALILAA